MEDISRELEREIARAKPAPFKTSRKKNVLVIDDFGELRSGTYLKVLVYLLLIVSLVSVILAGGLYTLYTRSVNENVQIKARLAGIEKKAKQLTKEKEILMARLVMSGKTPELESEVATTDSAAKAKVKKSGVMAKPESINGSQAATVAEAGSEIALSESLGVNAASQEDAPAETTVPEDDILAEAASAAGSATDQGRPPVVAVEKFLITRVGAGRLQIRFNIRNVKKEPGDISGRIFAVLKPETANASEWVVVPDSPLNNAVPSVYRKGQYFSISRFKPVRLNVNSDAEPEDFKQASVYIFSDEGELIFDREIEINEGN